MATCDLTLGRKIPCKDNVGGIKNIYFLNYNDVPYEKMTIVDEEISLFAASGTPSIEAYKYELIGAQSLEETNEISIDNGTSFWTQVLTAILQKQDKVTQKELKLASFGNPKIMIEDYLGNLRFMGAQLGCMVAVNVVSGANKTDLNGYNITATATENGPALYVADTAYQQLTIIEGTNS